MNLTPTLISTTIDHYVRGPPQPSWGLRYHLIFKLIQSWYSRGQTIEFIQRGIPTARIPAGVTTSESKIDNKYRHEAQIHLDRILKPYEHVLDDEWKDLKDDGIPFELVQVPDDGWESRKVRKTILYVHGGGYILGDRNTHRNTTSTFAKGANARVFVIEYRLAPQNQFPAALQDALAAYLYLLNPPRDAGFDPLNPEHIIIVGDSAGGGLALGLGLAIRDAGLPSCAGIVGLSPWVDLTTSTPSHWDDRYDLTDYIPRIKRFGESRAFIDYKKRVTALTERIKQNPGPKFWHDSFDKPDGNVNIYISNQGLAIPYASPMLAESLGGLPPLFLVAGDVERFRDQIVYFAHRSAEPTKYKGPSYHAGKFEKSPFQNPTNTTLEVYEEMTHGFHIFFIGLHPYVEMSYKRIMEFTDRVINTSETLPPSSYHSIGRKGIYPLNEQQKEILKCETIGIVPNVSFSEPELTPRRPISKIFMLMAPLLATVVYYAIKD